MEMAQYGDTEIPANKLKSTVKKLKACDKEKSGMMEEYDVSMPEIAPRHNNVNNFFCLLDFKSSS